jgi:hypothetical protein
VPHALFSLLGGLDARDLLGGPDRARPVLQALSYTARERHAEPWPIRETPPEGGPEELRAGLREGDFRVAYGAVRALAAAGRSTAIRDTILAEAARDDFNVCHRFLYAAKVLQRFEREPGLDVEALLFPVVHYHVTAPRDEGWANDRRPDRTLSQIFACAVGNLSGCVEYDWVPVAHAATLADTVLWWSAISRDPGVETAPRLADAFLPDALAEGNATPPDRGPVGRGNPEDVVAAIDARDERRARSVARGLEADRTGRDALGRALITACARIDGHLAFSHDAKVVAAAVRLTRALDSPHLAHVLSDVAAFLARLPEGAELADALF